MPQKGFMTENTTVVFQKIRMISEDEQEYWLARDLFGVLGYTDFRNFEEVVRKAVLACKNSKINPNLHFKSFTRNINLGKGGERFVSDVKLSRYACYLIMQNADPSKEVVALGQTYFAIQTRKQEVQNQYEEDQKRIGLRKDISHRNKHLAQVASKAGVRNYGMFNNQGYKGLYNGLGEPEIRDLKKLDKNQKILDHMGSEELADNIFKVAQADAKIDREDAVGEVKANQIHYEVGKKVRAVIKALGGTMPEELPRVDHIKEAKKRIKSAEPKKLTSAD